MDVIYKIYTEDTATVHDKAKLLSCTELNITSFVYYYMASGEGNPYPIFTAGSYNTNIKNRWRDAANAYSSAANYWTRSAYLHNGDTWWTVTNNGNLEMMYSSNARGILPVLRF